jgi:uncharacterized protein (DUF1330 family)
MKYYFVATVDITDPSWLQEYLRHVRPLVERYGGKVLARTSTIERLEGERPTPQTCLILEWPSRVAALRFYDSAEYHPYRERRLAGARTELLLVAGEVLPPTAQRMAVDENP